MCPRNGTGVLKGLTSTDSNVSLEGVCSEGPKICCEYRRFSVPFVLLFSCVPNASFGRVWTCATSTPPAFFCSVSVAFSCVSIVVSHCSTRKRLLGDRAGMLECLDFGWGSCMLKKTKPNDVRGQHFHPLTDSSFGLTCLD